MLEPSKFSLFMTAALVLLLTPGPAALYVMARGMDQGWRAGLVSVLGIEFATLIHIGVAALGISAVLLASPFAFDLLRYLGVAYLLYLGFRQIRSRPELGQTKTHKPERLRMVFSQAVLLELMNPQTAIFFLTFLPQFVNKEHGSMSLQFLTLGIVFVTLAVVAEGSYALLAGTLGHWLKGHSRILRAQHYLTGVVYLSLGMMAALVS